MALDMMSALLKISAKGEGFKEVENQIKAVETVGEHLNKSLGGVNGVIGNLTGGVVALGGGLTAAGLVAFAKSSMDAGESMLLLSQKTGVSVENLSKFRAVASKSGTDIDSVGNAMVKLSKSMMETATTGTGPAANAFRTLGISVTDSSGKLRGADQVMLDVADKFRLLPDGADKAALALALFGKKGAEMIPMLDKGRQAVEGLNASMSTDFAKKSHEFNDQLEAIKGKMGSIGRSLATEMMPTLSRAVDYIGNFATGIAEFFKTHEKGITTSIEVTAHLIKTFLPLAGVIMGIVAAFQAYQAALKAVALAESIAEAMSGPGGWAVLAAGVVAAGAATWAVSKAFDGISASAKKASGNTKEFGQGIEATQQDLQESLKLQEGLRMESEQYKVAVQGIKDKYDLLKTTIEATSSAVQRQSTLKQATFSADMAINNAAKSILESELKQATTKEQKIRLTTQIMNLDLANARLQMEAAQAQIASEIEIARLKRQTALEQLKSTEAVILEAKARKQPTAELEQQLALQKIALSGADAEYKLAQQVGNEKLRADKAEYDASVYQINSTAQMQLDSLNKQDQALNNIVSTSGRLADSSGVVAGNFADAAASASSMAASYVGAGGRVSSQPQFTNVFGQRFASGGYVNGPTPALVGEAGPEYIIPAGQMQSASSAYLGGARGAAVLQGNGNGAAPQVNIQTGPVMQFNGQNYVTVEDLHKATQQVAEGVIGRLRTPSARLALGLR